MELQVPHPGRQSQREHHPGQARNRQTIPTEKCLPRPIGGSQPLFADFVEHPGPCGCIDSLVEDTDQLGVVEAGSHAVFADV